MKRYYPAIIEKNPAAKAAKKSKGMRGLFGVIFPDVDGCYSAGDTVEEAIRNAGEALSLHLEALRDAGKEMPATSGLDDAAGLLAKAGVTDGAVAAIVLIPVSLQSAPVRLSITMDQDLVDDIDAVASNRSAFLAEASRAELARRGVGRIPVYRLSNESSPAPGARSRAEAKRRRA